MSSYIKRLVDVRKFKSSAFLFGPRMTGKTTIIDQSDFDFTYDFLDPEIELRYRGNLSVFGEELKNIRAGSTIAIDEIQKIPELLNYVQVGIEKYGHKYLLSGSSARKLKRQGINLLGGRALDLKLHPLSYLELKCDFNDAVALHYGTLPRIYLLATCGNNDIEKVDNLEEVRASLRSYYTTYIKEEIQLEAATRNIGAFQRFLNVAAQFNANIIEYSNIAAASAVPASTVKEYFTILEDTLLGKFLWPHASSERKKRRPKFYFFDCGVVNSIQNRLIDPPTAQEIGFLFETLMFNQLIASRDYFFKEHEFSYWREGGAEVDIIVEKHNKPIMAIECKSGMGNFSYSAIKEFKKRYSKVPIVIASLHDKRPRTTEAGVDILPWKSVLEMYNDL